MGLGFIGKLFLHIIILTVFNLCILLLLFLLSDTLWTLTVISIITREPSNFSTSILILLNFKPIF
jgi:hypothetical protein